LKIELRWLPICLSDLMFEFDELGVWQLWAAPNKSENSPISSVFRIHGEVILLSSAVHYWKGFFSAWQLKLEVGEWVLRLLMPKTQVLTTVLGSRSIKSWWEVFIKIWLFWPAALVGIGVTSVLQLEQMQLLGEFKLVELWPFELIPHNGFSKIGREEERVGGYFKWPLMTIFETVFKTFNNLETFKNCTIKIFYGRYFFAIS